MGSEFININKLRVCSYNCKNIQTSIGIVQDLCSHHDVILLQEHWLCKDDLSSLAIIHTDFAGHGISAMENDKLLTGRPYGGVAILWRKSLGVIYKVLDFDDSRITGIQFDFDSNPVIFLSVYLPYECSDNFDEYMHYISRIGDIIESSSSPYIYVSGDYNANLSCTSVFGSELLSLCDQNNMVISDHILLNSDTYTFVSGVYGSTSWLDHCVTTYAGHHNVSDVKVLLDVVGSDHLPLSFNVQKDLVIKHNDGGSHFVKKHKWDTVTAGDLTL